MKFKISIFIASPGDVTVERNIVENVCKKLEKKYNNISINPVRWENYPQSYQQDAQSNINTHLQPSKCDIVIVIFWHRFGTFLPKNYIGPITKDCPVTGTQWEFEEALASKKPAIHFYLKKANLEILKNSEQKKQYTLLQNFLKKIGVHHGNAHHGFHEFVTTTEFKQRLYKHLTVELDRLIKKKRATFYWKGILVTLLLLSIFFGFYFYNGKQIKYLKNVEKNRTNFLKTENNNSINKKISAKAKDKIGSNLVLSQKDKNDSNNTTKTDLQNTKPKKTNKKSISQKEINKKQNSFKEKNSSYQELTAKDKNSLKKMLKANLQNVESLKKTDKTEKELQKRLYDFFEYWLWVHNTQNVPLLGSLYEREFIFNKVKIKRKVFLKAMQNAFKKMKDLKIGIDNIKIRQLNLHIYKISFTQYFKNFNNKKNNDIDYIIVDTSKKRYQIIEQGSAMPRYYVDAQPRPQTLVHLEGLHPRIYKNLQHNHIFHDTKTYHIGDEKIKGWKPLSSKCYKIPFKDNGNIGNYLLLFSGYGVDALQIKLNGKNMGKPMHQEKLGAKKSNFWVHIWRIFFDNHLKNRKNIISICSSRVKENNYDDFMIKNILLYKMEP